MLRSFIWVLALTLLTTPVGAASPETRIVNATNVRVRSGPGTDASIVGELLFGTDVVALERTGGANAWDRVTSEDGPTGWVQGSLTTPVGPGGRDQTRESMVRARLERLSQLTGEGFGARLQFFEFIDRISAGLTDREAEGRFALYRLRAMGHVALGIPFGRSKADPYRAWIRAHQEAVWYDEPGGSWMVSVPFVIGVHETYGDTGAADDIGWFLVQNGMGGECEGDVPCYIDRTDQLYGQYLRWHPGGQHTDEANARIATGLNEAMDNLRAFPRVLREFDPSTRSKLRAALDLLVSAVKSSTSVRKAEALGASGRFEQLCATDKADK